MKSPLNIIKHPIKLHGFFEVTAFKFHRFTNAKQHLDSSGAASDWPRSPYWMDLEILSYKSSTTSQERADFWLFLTIPKLEWVVLSLSCLLFLNMETSHNEQKTIYVFVGCQRLTMQTVCNFERQLTSDSEIKDLGAWSCWSCLASSGDSTVKHHQSSTNRLWIL